MIKGIPIDLNGRELVVPPISLGGMEQFQAAIEAFYSAGGGVLPPGIAKTTIDVVHAAVKRNYPDMARADLAELLDVGNMNEAMEAVMDVGAKKRKELEAKAASGEAAAPLTGAPSTPG